MNRLKVFYLIYGMSDVAVCRLTFRLRLRSVGGESSGFTLLSDSANVSVPCECLDSAPVFLNIYFIIQLALEFPQHI